MILTVEEAKAHLRLQHEEEDAYLASLIQQAQAVAEDYCRVAFDEKGEAVGILVRLNLKFVNLRSVSLTLNHIPVGVVPFRAGTHTAFS